MANFPTVSLVIPTHRPSHFRIALGCALAQTYSNLEILVLDNSETSEIKELVSQNNSVQYFRNTDRSPVTNVFSAFRFANGEYMKYLCDDDLIFPHTIEAMVEAINKVDDPRSIALVSSFRQVVGETNAIKSVKRLLQIDQPTVLNGKNAMKLMLANLTNFIGEFSTVLFSRSFYNTVSPKENITFYDHCFGGGLEDVATYFTGLRKGDLLFLPYELSVFRQHENSGSNPSYNPNFHQAITDWLVLLSGAIEEGIISAREIKPALERYINLRVRFSSHFDQELTRFDGLYEGLKLKSAHL